MQNLPQTLVTLSARSLTIVRGMGPRLVARFAKGNIGNFWRALGRYSESVGLRVIRELASRIPGLRYVGQAALGASILDVVLTLRNCVVWVEMKYRLPDKKGGASKRLVKQAKDGVEAARQAAANGRRSQFVLWSLKAPTPRELRFTTNALGTTAASTRMVHGVGGLFFFLFDLFGPC